MVVYSFWFFFLKVKPVLNWTDLGRPNWPRPRFTVQQAIMVVLARKHGVEFLVFIYRARLDTQYCAYICVTELENT